MVLFGSILMNKKTEALIKTLEGTDKVAVIHDNGPGGANTVAFVEGPGDGARSTMVGDMVLVGTDKYVCEKMGWSKI